MTTIMNTAEFIRVTDLLKKEKIAKSSGNIFAAMMAMHENRPEAVCADGFKMSIQASDDYGDDGVYGYVPLTVVDAIIAKHGGILLNEQ